VARFAATMKNIFAGGLVKWFNVGMMFFILSERPQSPQYLQFQSGRMISSDFHRFRISEGDIVKDVIHYSSVLNEHLFYFISYI
jgi:hypothetical protein